jgi:hypothetical protein
MTDKDVIKALEIESTPMERNCVRATYKEDCLGFYCTKTGKLAENCMECKEHTMDWRGRHSKATLDLINRQQAEIERLKEEVKAEYGATFLAKSEAIKEFAEKVKAKCDYMNDYYGLDYGWAIDRIYEEVDELVKEMVGEGNG